MTNSWTCCAKPMRNWDEPARLPSASRKDELVATREVEIVNRLGMHARPAMQFVETAKRFACEVTVHAGDQKVNGKSIMEMMILAAVPGTVLRLEGDGDDADACLDALEALVEAKFHED